MVAQAFIPAAREAEMSQDNLVRPYLKKQTQEQQLQAWCLDPTVERSFMVQTADLRMMQALAKTANPKAALLSNRC